MPIHLSTDAKKLIADSSMTAKRRLAVRDVVLENGGFDATLEKMFASDASGFALSIWPEEFGELLARSKEPRERERCEERALEIWEVRPQHRLLLLACFPHRTDWATFVARALLAGESFSGGDERVLYRGLQDTDLLVAIAKGFGVDRRIIDVVIGMEEKAALPLGLILENAKPKEVPLVACALACVGTPEASKRLAESLSKKAVVPHAVAHFDAFPHLASDALSTLAKKKTKAGELAASIVKSSSENEEAAQSSSATTEEEASDDELPSVLVRSLWQTDLPRPERNPIVINPPLETPREPCRFIVSEPERQRLITEMFDIVGENLQPETAQAMMGLIMRGEPSEVDGRLDPEFLLPLLAEPPSEDFRLPHNTPLQVLLIHGQRGLDALAPHFLDVCPLTWIECPKTVAKLVESQHGYVAGALDSALAFLERIPAETAIAGLIPLATGPLENRARRVAENVLRYLVTKCHGDDNALVLRIAGENFGENAVRSVEEILEFDGDHFIDFPSPPKMPDCYHPHELRRPRLRGSQKLVDRRSMKLLDQMLSASTLARPVPGLDDVKEACDPQSLANHAWDLISAWNMNGAPDSAQWMRDAVALLAPDNDELIRRLTPAIHGFGVVHMLGLIGTDAALMELVTIRSRHLLKNVHPSSHDDPESAIRAIAERRNVDLEVLEDQFVPSLAIDERGEAHFDLGQRKLTVTLGHHLKPILRDQRGTTLKTFPRATKGDDLGLIEAAHEAVTQLTEDLSALAELRTAALERAMITGRSWTLAAFMKTWVLHPITIHLARGVIWSASNGQRFRIAEDRSFSDVNDASVTLPVDDVTLRITVTHPVELSDEERKAFTTLLADYEVIAPFDQLTRVSPGFSEAELIASDIAAVSHQDSKAFLRDLERIGFRGASYHYRTLRFANGDVARVGIPPKLTLFRNGSKLLIGEANDIERFELARIRHRAQLGEWPT